MNIIKKFNYINSNISFTSFVTNKTFNLKINEKSFVFPIDVKTVDSYLGYKEPKQWLIEEHKNNCLHEPGLINLLFLLSEMFKEKKIGFWDIGALYGYNSILASKIFNDVDIHCVEANPFSCKYIDNLMKTSNYKKFHVTNAFVDKKSIGKQIKFIYGYKFLDNKAFFLSEYKKIIFKNIIKKIINYFFKNKFQVIEPKKISLKHISLNDLIHNNIKEINILKIDAEGYQSIFLPPASSNLIREDFILLLEFDDIYELKKFNSSNKQLCDPFLKKGYKLFWFNHRIKDAKLELKTSFDKSMETNSLGLLLPSKYINLNF